MTRISSRRSSFARALSSASSRSTLPRERFSPTTRYEDYAISPTLFHWQSQGKASESSDVGRRYNEQRTNGWEFQLFVRPTIHGPYVALGKCTYQSHVGSRPMSITWRLETPIPAELFQLYATLLAA